MVLHNHSRVNTDLLSIPASIKHGVYNQTKFINDAAGSHGAATLLESMGCSLSCNQARQSRCHNGRAELIGFGVCLGCPSKESGKAARQDIALPTTSSQRARLVTHNDGVALADEIRTTLSDYGGALKVLYNTRKCVTVCKSQMLIGYNAEITRRPNQNHLARVNRISFVQNVEEGAPERLSISTCKASASLRNSFGLGVSTALQ